MANGLGRDIGTGAVKGASLGAQAGSMVAPGIGTAIGAGLGALAGGTFGAFQNKDDRQRLKELERMEEMNLLGLDPAARRDMERQFRDPMAAAARERQAQTMQMMPFLQGTPAMAIAAQAQMQEQAAAEQLQAAQEVESLNQAEIGSQKQEMQDIRNRLALQGQYNQAQAVQAFTQAVPELERAMQRQAMVDAQSTFQSIFGAFSGEDEELLAEAMNLELGGSGYFEGEYQMGASNASR